ncbi:MAG: L,D-transpeptidase [Deltaproteobacteria bacterium]|nr:L,D-transpeptidase [Deltaproteobacteria bacterium]
MKLNLHAVLLGAFALFFCLPPTPVPAAQTVPPSRCKARFPSDGLVQWGCVEIKKGDTIEGLFGEGWRDAARLNRMDRRHATPGKLIKAPKDPADIRGFTPLPREYPAARDHPKFILIDLSEQFLGAYEFGRLVFSAPAATGERGNETPAGRFRITAYSRNHRSSKYFIGKTSMPYPMRYALRFFIKDGISYWIHGRDMPGHPASHGCVGLYDEEMQKKYYKYPKDPELEDAKRLYEWVVGPIPDDNGFHVLNDGPEVEIRGDIP